MQWGAMAEPPVVLEGFKVWGLWCRVWVGLGWFFFGSVLKYSLLHYECYDEKGWCNHLSP